MQKLSMNGQCLKNVLNGFEWVEDLSQFKEDFIKNYDEDSNKGYFLEVDVEYPKNLHNCIVIHRFYQKKEIKNVISLLMTFMTRITMLFT